MVFLCLLLLLGGAAGAVIWTGQIEAEPVPPGVPSASPEASADMTLTDEEAIARLAHLDEIRKRALERRDARLLAQAVFRDGPAFSRLRQTIRTLKRDDVRLRHRKYEVVRARVVARNADRIRLRQVVIIDLQFYDVAGNNVTEGSGRERQVLEATLRNANGEWLFYKGRLIDAVPIPR